MNIHRRTWIQASTYFVLALSILFSTISFGQQTTVLVDQEVAQREARENARDFGFENVYFSTQNLKSILQDSNTHQVRFYTALNDDQRSQTQIAVGIDGDGNEMGQYVMSSGVEITILDKESAVQKVESSSSSPLKTVCCTFSSKEVESFTMQEGSTGLHVKPGLLEGRPTLTMVAAATLEEGDESGTQDFGGTYLKASAPCPYACGDGFLTRFED